MSDISVAVTMSPRPSSDTCRGASGILAHVPGLSSRCAPSSKSAAVTSGGDGDGGGLGGSGDGGGGVGDGGGDDGGLGGGGDGGDRGKGGGGKGGGGNGGGGDGLGGVSSALSSRHEQLVTSV